jgi:hypothetical protein
MYLQADISILGESWGYLDHTIREIIEVELHLENMNRKVALLSISHRSHSCDKDNISPHRAQIWADPVFHSV